MPVTIYNASNMHVLVRVASDSTSGRQRELGVWSFLGKTNDTYELTTKSGFSMVQRFSKFEFFPEVSKKTAYVSIKPTGDNNSMYMFLCEDLPVKAEGSGVIISKQFYIRNSKENWYDIDGNNHDPKIEQEGTEKIDESLKDKNKKLPEPSGLQYLRKPNSDGKEKNELKKGK